jgi:hypothetical protein
MTRQYHKRIQGEDARLHPTHPKYGENNQVYVYSLAYQHNGEPQMVSYYSCRIVFRGEALMYIPFSVFMTAITSCVAGRAGSTDKSNLWIRSLYTSYIVL